MQPNQPSDPILKALISFSSSLGAALLEEGRRENPQRLSRRKQASGFIPQGRELLLQDAEHLVQDAERNAQASTVSWLEPEMSFQASGVNASAFNILGLDFKRVIPES